MVKRIVLFLLAALLMATWTRAAHVNETAARATAGRFLSGLAADGRLRAPAQGGLRLAHAEVSTTAGAMPVYYIFNAADAFVVVAGDDRAREVLAWGDQALDMARVPDNMQYWLDTYKRQLEYLLAHPDVQVSAPQRAGQVVNPLLTANWSQATPYWNECPVFGSDTCYTGCPATSLSMVFHYWRYPRQQTPAAPSYMIPTYGVVLPELPPTTFDWDNMLDNYTGAYTAVEASAVAHLMRYIGQVEQMDYTISGSGAYGKDVLRAVKHFEYDQDAQLLFKTDDLGYDNYSDAQWAALIQTELEAGRPIVYCAYDNYTGAGHAFNVDGYDGNGGYHINWGWNGRGNGHFALNAFTYEGYTFGTGQQMVIGIQPPEDYQMPRLQAYPMSLALQCYINQTAVGTVSLKGTNLTGDVTLTLDDPEGVFAIDATTLARDVAEGGHDITVTYSPTAVGTHSATLRLESPDTDPVTVTLTGTAPLEVYAPVMLPAAEACINLTSFRADWTDSTPAANVASYTLEVQAKPAYSLLEEADFSDLPRMSPTNQASHATDYLPDGWTFSGSEFNLEGGCIMPRRNSVITTDDLNLTGYDKVTVVVTARSYGSWGDPSELTIATSLASETIALPFSYAETAVVLDCAETDKVRFTAGYYPMIQAIRIYAGDASGLVPLRAAEQGDAGYRLITGITGKAYTVENLTAGGVFFYKVKALYTDGSESEWSNTQMVTLTENTHNFQPGDLNHDGKLNIADVTALINALLTQIVPCQTCADVNHDGIINIADVTVLINRLLTQ